MSDNKTDDLTSALEDQLVSETSADAEVDQDLVEPETDDSLTFSDGVIEKIVAIATRQVPGVLGMKGGWVDRFTETFGAKDPGKGVEVEVCDDGRVRLYVSVLIEYGAYAPQIFEDARRMIIHEIERMTSLEVAGINLRVEDVLTEEEYEASRRARTAHEAQNHKIQN